MPTRFFAILRVWRHELVHRRWGPSRCRRGANGGVRDPVRFDSQFSQDYGRVSKGGGFEISVCRGMGQKFAPDNFTEVLAPHFKGGAWRLE